MDDLEWLGEEARSLLAASDLVVPFIGAGVSCAASLPDADGLAAWMRGLPEVVPLALPGELRLFDLAAAVVQEGVLSEDDLTNRVAEFLDLANHRFTVTPTLLSIAGASSRVVATFNYDLLIEDAAQRRGVEARSLTISDRDMAEATDAVRAGGIDDGVLRVIHVHGHTRCPSSIVLGPASYRIQAGRLRPLLTLLYKERTICFIATSLDEVYILDELATLRRINSAPSHVLVTDEENALTINSRASVSPYRHGVFVRTFATGQWAALDHLTALLEVVVPPPATAIVVDRTAVTPDALYVSNVLVASSPAESNGYIDAIVAEAGMRETFSEEDVAEYGRRTVVVGSPGSGKTQLLRRLGELSPGGESPVFISLADIPTTIGEPSSLLRRWAEGGESLRAEHQPVGDDALEVMRFHFLLDGLDEASPAGQERIAMAVVRMAAAFPQHRFTVASRQVGALEVFPEDDWQHLAIRPGPEWRERFLQTQGISWPELLAEAPALSDIHELLRLPFFLRRVVEIWRAGEIERFAGTWSLVDRIVSDAIGGDLAGLPGSALRVWLRKIAFAMQISGRTSITPPELAMVPLPNELSVLGTAEEIAERLVATPLVQKRGDAVAYQFVHRLIGEGLVAEELNMLGPTETVLDVVAPSVNKGLGGLRVDWAVPVALAASQTPAWRHALARRDELSAAKSTPADASRDERLDAGRLIWERYVEWEIWLFDNSQLDFLDAGDALVRVLAKRDLVELEAEITECLDDDSPFVRGNALQLIGRAGLGELISDDRLAEFIRIDENVVVRRNAAVSAGRLERVGLFDLIAERLGVASDEVERQDLAYAARELGTTAQLLALVLALPAGNRLPAGIIEHALEGRISAKDQLRVVRSRARQDSIVLASDRESFLDLVSGLEEVDDESTELVAYIALVWQVSSAEVVDMLVSNPEASFAGMRQAIDDGVADQYRVVAYADLFTRNAWERSGFPEDILSWVEQRRTQAGGSA